ncbi:MAG: hypothetical protein L0H54_11595 [Alcaligenaceae bacterium]|nr:hypothetical protein [Alcaligenaceae bacterium]
MKIEQYSVSMASQHTYSKQVSRTETLRAWIGDQRPDFEATGLDDRGMSASARVAISDAARQAVAAAQQQGATAQESRAESVAPANPVSDEKVHGPKLDLLIRIVEAMTGKKIKVLDAGDIDKLARVDEALVQTKRTPVDRQAVPQGWGVEYDYHEETHELERTSFTASGEILTADGKRIQFDLALQMHREYRQEISVSFRAGDAVRKDPLVINFDGNAAELSDMKFDFDIDADGEADKISFVDPGSGFLALDRNGNNRIDDGSELFGARTGDGFAELAAFDTDNNGWIDETDSIYSALRIWTRDGGVDQLSTLAERNIGALYLGQAATPFDLKDHQNRQHGQVLSTGVYLSENGKAGTIQQLDLFV